MNRHDQLLEIIRALGARICLSNTARRRQQQADHDGNEGDDDEALDKGQPGAR